MAQKSAEILCIGTELLLGDIVNTNAAYLARRLAQLGIHVYHQTVVGDNPDRLLACLEIAFSRCDIVITTGGLGPTYDDLSKETIAGYFGLKLVANEPTLEGMREYFARIGRDMTPNNRKQAMMPEGCVVFPNPNGTAPGCAVGQGGKTAFLLPGPPREMEPMFEASAVPLLERESDCLLVSRNLHFFGIGESALEEKLRGLMTSSLNPTVAPYAKTGEVMLRVTARVQEASEAPAVMQPAIDRIMSEAGGYLYGVDVGDLETAVVRLYQEKGLQLAAAESCTGGLLAERITSVPGASRVFEWGVCTYSDKTKTDLLGVSRSTLEAYGAVSEETAREMAAGALKQSSADVALAVTGNAGPESSGGKPVGMVYAAVESAWYSEVVSLDVPRSGGGARGYIRTLAASHALHLALKAARLYRERQG